MDEKRRHLRFDVFFNVICSIKGALKKLQINNLSKGGVGVSSDAALKKGDDVEIELTIPGDNIPVVLKGEVAWTADPMARREKHSSGIKLKDEDTAHRSQLLGYIYQKWISPLNKKK